MDMETEPSDNKISIEKAMTMSLDDYIYESGITDMTRQNNRNSNQQSTQYNNANIPPLLSLNNDNKYYNSLTNDIPKPSSQQWRFMPPNDPNRPVGMPPLVPFQDEIIHNSRGTGNTGMNQRRNRNRGRYGHQNNRANNNHNGNSNSDTRGNNTNNRSNNANNRSNDLEIQVTSPQLRKNKWNNQQNNRDPYRGVNRNQSNFKPRVSVQHRLDNITKESKQRHINNGPSDPVSAVAASYANSLELTPANGALGANFLKSCLAIMPTIANALLEHCQAIATCKPEKKYDLKVQKEISEIQGKQLLYTCPGTAVVSSDGPGIEINTLPHTTDLSMNARFA